MKLTPQQVRAAEAHAQQLFDWERLVEGHCTVLRRDPNRYAVAHLEYAAVASKVAMPPPTRNEPNELQQTIDEVEAKLDPDCTDFYGRVKFVAEAMFLVRTKNLLMAERDRPVFMEAAKLKTTLHKNHPYQVVHAVMPAVLHPFLADLTQPALPLPAHAPAHAPTPVEYPLTLPGREFTSAQIPSDATRARLAPEAVMQYHQNPDPLPGLIFGSTEGKVFMLWSIVTTAEKERLFYVLFMDEGSLAIAHSAEDFFMLLKDAEQIS
ncbi:hypothetical protein B0H13DRAFT_323211 [Mycena leptocephala]|nr:hypothetical protein B0H13DRAFT_323211 [Mycena leptocephala]